MRVALNLAFRADKKEPLGALLARVHEAFLASGSAPELRFTFSDTPVPGFVSSIDRILKRYPELAPLVAEASIAPNTPPVRQMTNRDGGPVVPFETLRAIASGVPRSFPIHSAQLSLIRPDFGPVTRIPVGPIQPGIAIGDSWWVNGRMRSLSAWLVVDAAPGVKGLPEQPESVRAIIEACGKVQKTVQLPLGEIEDGVTPMRGIAPPEVSAAVAAVVRDYRARLPEILAAAHLPHDLPPALELLRTQPLGEVSGPRKPALVRAFKPMGYDCTAESGMFTLKRRTAGNLTIEFSMDVGTWSRQVTAHFHVYGLGFSAMLPVPASERSGPAQYPIGDATRWQQIVDNFAALVAEYDRTFVPAIEAAAGPSPEWYKPES